MIRSLFRRTFRWVVRGGVVAGGVAIVRQVLRQDQDESRPVSTTTPSPTAKPAEPAPATARARPAQKKAAAPSRAAKKKAAPRAAAPSGKAAAWVEPVGGVCPTTHQVKAKMSSRIFHLPGMRNYDRTTPDRCYADAAAAEADGLRPAKS